MSFVTRRTTLALLASLGVAMAAPALAAPFAPYSADSFKTAVASGKPVVVHVHAQWCPTCRRQQPILDSLLSQGPYGPVTAIRVDFDHERDFLRAHRVSYQSTIIVFKDGKEVARTTGVTDASQIESIVAKAL